MLGGFPEVQAINPIYKLLLLPGFDYSQNRALIISIAAALLVYSVLALPRLKGFFAHRYISQFGRFTYSLYLLHLPVLLTICTAAFTIVLPIGYHKAVIIAVIATWILLIPLTYLFERYIDAPSIRISKQLALQYLQGEAGGATKYWNSMKRKLRRLYTQE